MREWIRGQRTWHLTAGDMEGHTMCGRRLAPFGLLYQKGAYPKGKLCKRCEKIVLKWEGHEQRVVGKPDTLKATKTQPVDK